MSKIIDSMNNEHIKALTEAHIVQQRRSERDMAEASRRGRAMRCRRFKHSCGNPIERRGRLAGT